MYDKFNREITYLRISVTDRCNLRCVYCMPEQGVLLKRHRDILSYEKIIEIAREGISLGIKKIRITGGEPLVRRGIVSFLHQLGKLPGLEELTLTTNGVLLSPLAQELKKTGLNRINISLDTLDPGKYKQLTRIGNIEDVLQGIDAAIDAGFENSKLNMVVIPGTNDDEVEKMKAFCKEKRMQLQRINHYSLDNIHSIDRDYRAERPLNCSECNRIRLTADGKFKPCLFSDIEIPVDLNHLEESFEKAIREKPASGRCNTTRGNWEIGG